MTFDPTFGKTGFALRVFDLRFHQLRLTQRQFARRYGLSHAMVRDAEQGRRPCKPLVGLVALIEANPAGAAELIAAGGSENRSEPR